MSKLAPVPTGSSLRIYLNKTVEEAARDRIEWLMREFKNVMVTVSGGKDSTVVLHLALEVAAELGRLPLTIYWLDQEAEWNVTVDQVREWMYRDDVRPVWLQVPFRIFNAASASDHWLNAWDPAESDKWIHEQDPLSRKRNIYGTDRFAELFGGALEQLFEDEPACSISGVRCEESPHRRMGLTHYTAYKHVTWGSVTDKRRRHYAFYPIYDWGYRDVWKFIADGGHSYCALYDKLYRHGVPVRSMRVSNLHHETAVHSLFYLQEFEPETYQRMTARIGGIDMAGKLGAEDYFPRELPFMFASWREYRDYLLRELVDDEYRPPLAKRMNEMDRKLPADRLTEAHKMHVRSIMTCDWEGVKMDAYLHNVDVWRAQKDNRPNWKTAEEEPLPA